MSLRKDRRSGDSCCRVLNSLPPIYVGDTVVVISVDKAGAFIEGLAVIKGLAKGKHRYKVRLIGDTRLHDRVVHRIYQHAPEEAVSWLNALLREPSEDRLDEFFPDDL